MATNTARPLGWRPVDPDDVPIHAVVRYRDRGRTVAGTAVDVLDAGDRPSLIVRTDDGQHHVAPGSTRLEMLED